MEDQHNNAKRSTDARVEHIDVPDGDGYIRWLTLNRGTEANGLGDVDDMSSGGSNQTAKGRRHRAMDLIKSTMLFWR